MKRHATLLLRALRRRSMTTMQIRDELGIGHPAGRVDELRQAGYEIETVMEKVQGRLGKATVARYYYRGIIKRAA